MTAPTMSPDLPREDHSRRLDGRARRTARPERGDGYVAHGQRVP